MSWFCIVAESPTRRTFSLMRNHKRVQPNNGLESVWDYPRPPRFEHDPRRVDVRVGGVEVAGTNDAFRVLETSHPPGYYIPADDVRTDLLVAESRTTVCEWKGVATYWAISVGDRDIESVAWMYPDPLEPYRSIAGYFSFYPGKVDEATVGGERVRPQAGGFYGGWILDEIVGPFKGEPGTLGW